MGGEVGFRFHSRVRSESRPDVERAAATDGNRADHDLAVFQFDNLKGGVPADRHIVADVEQVPAALEQGGSVVDVDALADPGAQGAQHDVLEHRPLEQAPGHQPDGPSLGPSSSARRKLPQTGARTGRYRPISTFFRSTANVATAATV